MPPSIARVKHVLKEAIDAYNNANSQSITRQTTQREAEEVHQYVLTLLERPGGNGSKDANASEQ